MRRMQTDGGHGESTEDGEHLEMLCASLMTDTLGDRACGRAPVKGAKCVVESTDVRVEAAELVGMIVQLHRVMDDLGHGEVMLPDDVSCCMCGALDAVI